MDETRNSPAHNHDQPGKHDEPDNHDEPDKHDAVADLLNVAIEWARRGRDRLVTVAAIELDDLAALRADPRMPGAGRVLESVAARLAQLQSVSCAVSADTLVLVSTAPRSLFDAYTLADRAARMIARPLVVDAFEISLVASIGVCLCRSGLSDGETALRDARFTLDEAQRRGRGQVVVFSPELHRRRVSAPTEVTMQFEPVVSLNDGRVASYEATVVPGPTPGFRDADASTFEFLIDQLARTMTTWPDDVDVSFNVSLAQLLDSRFPRPVLVAADRYGLDHERFAFEIDEGQVSEDLWLVRHALTRLRDDGFRVGMDGFSQAASLLDTLALLPVRFVKFDRGLSADTDPKEWDLLTISDAARALRISTVAAGIETLPELALAIAHEYGFAQGPLFGVQIADPPMPRS